VSRIDLGCSLEQFRDAYFEKAMIFVPGGLQVGGYSWPTVSAEFYGIDPGDRRIRLFRNGEVKKEEYVFRVQDGDIARHLYKEDAMATELRNGSSLVISRFDLNSIFVSELCAELSSMLGERCGGNAYISSGGDGTFGKHWDRHCVFVLQLLGRKLWRVYRPTFELPLQFQASQDHKDDCPREPVFERILEAGDVLYIPRGWWHEVFPLDGQPSMHIAAGIHTTNAYEYLRWVIANIAPNLLSARQSINRDTTVADLAETREDFLQEFMSREVLDEFKQSQRKIIRAQKPVAFENIFDGAENMAVPAAGSKDAQ
jgi:ribosomal protein L16 Arg81 hydroxylase